MVLAPKRQAVQDHVRYRRPGDDSWSDAMAVNLSASGLLFRTCAQIPEINSPLEIHFDGDDTRTVAARVARRVLHCWPDPCVQIAVQFVDAPPRPAADRPSAPGEA